MYLSSSSRVIVIYNHKFILAIPNMHDGLQYFARMFTLLCFHGLLFVIIVIV